MKRLLMVHLPDNQELKTSLEDSMDVTDMSFAFVCLCGFWDGSCLSFSAFILLLLEPGRLPQDLGRRAGWLWQAVFDFSPPKDRQELKFREKKGREFGKLELEITCRQNFMEQILLHSGFSVIRERNHHCKILLLSLFLILYGIAQPPQVVSPQSYLF